MANYKLKSPFSLMLAGPSGCGKTWLLERLIREWKTVFDHKPKKIYICHMHEQPIYDKIIENAPCSVELVKSLPSNLETEPGSLVVIDDLVAECPKEIKDWHVRKSHHYQSDVITIAQNIFDKGKEHRTSSLNSHYIALFKNPRDSSQISHFAKQFSPGDLQYIISSFKDATKAPYSYLLFDLKQSTNNLVRVRNSFFPDELVVYVPNTTDVLIYNGLEDCTKNIANSSTIGKIKTGTGTTNIKKRKQ